MLITPDLEQPPLISFLKEDDDDEPYTKECENTDIKYKFPDTEPPTGERTPEEQCAYVKATHDEDGKEYEEDEC